MLLWIAVAGTLLLFSPFLTWFGFSSSELDEAVDLGLRYEDDLDFMEDLGLIDEEKRAQANQTVTGFGSSTFVGLLALASGGLALAVVTTRLRISSVSLPAKSWQVVSGAGTTAAIAIAVRATSPPSLSLLPSGGDDLGDLLPGLAATALSIEATPQLGLFVGLLAAIAIATAGLALDGGPLARGGRVRKTPAPVRSQDE